MHLKQTLKKAPGNHIFFVKKNYLIFFLLLHISSSYAKILGETNFRTQEIPQSGSKDGEKKKKRKD